MTAAPPARDLLASLNPDQREAVVHGDGPLLVLAGAGSGKTRVLTTRIANLVRERGVHPGSILAVTFTNKAAGEMRSRIAAMLGEEPRGMWCGTFHSIGARLVRMHADRVGRTSSYTIYDEDDYLALIKRVMERVNVSSKEFAPQAIAAVISDAKNRLISEAEFSAAARDAFTRATTRVYDALETHLRQNNAATFDDLLTLSVALLEQHEDIRTQYQRRFRHILVDEYQDTNRAQYRMIAVLGKEHGNVTVVGDDDQSIYGWRGADIRNILDFERDFPNAAVVRLETNYRSTPEILHLANAAIAANSERLGKTLRASRGSGPKPVLLASLDERDEADYIATEIERRHYSTAGIPYRDVAILYRTNAQSRALEETLRRKGVPYRLVGAVRFYDRREIRDLLAYLKLIANPRDDEAFRRAVSVPRRGLGETTIEALGVAATQAGRSLLEAAGDESLTATVRPAARTALADFARLIGRLAQQSRDASVDELLRSLVAAIGYEAALRAEGPEAEERIENVESLIAGAAEFVVDEGGEVGLTPLDHYLQRTTLVAGIDVLDPTADAVTLMTLHNAKGLEFRTVYIAGLEEGLFPLSRSKESGSVEEERRLFYVGITRAEEALVLTHARSRRRNGEQMASLPSSFLSELPREMVNTTATIRLRASGRFGAFSDDPVEPRAYVPRLTPSARRPGKPVERRSHVSSYTHEESQDTPVFFEGERVRHPRFGSGTIAELAGVGREAKVVVDFDDASIGRKRLVIAFAGLERGLG
ncbi:MAG TPA: UvrD-helicase domain-containing protein [Gemmatimonadaceae bacterium]|nr:UvrD-helicase domain-containing protein [Gemmatimonadaceae bacterium]